MLIQPELKLLDFLTLRAGSQIGVRQIARETGLGKSTVSRAVQTLEQYSFVRCEMQGRNKLVSVEKDSEKVARLRVAFNLLDIEPALLGLKEVSRKIILFGSCAKGLDTAESDIDIAIITSQKDAALRIANKIKLSRPIQWVMKTPAEYVVLNSKEAAFAREIGQGIVLWEDYESAGVR